MKLMMKATAFSFFATWCCLCAAANPQAFASDTDGLCGWLHQQNVSDQVKSLSCRDGVSRAQLSELLSLPQGDQQNFCLQFNIHIQNWRRLQIAWSNDSATKGDRTPKTRGPRRPLEESDTATTAKLSVESACPSCHNLSVRMRRLIVALRFATRNGLKSWVDTDGATSSGLNAKLLHDAFAGRRVAFIGDSTLRGLRNWLCALKRGRNHSLVEGLQYKTVEEAYAAVKVRRVRKTEEAIEGPVAFYDSNMIGGVAAKDCRKCWKAVARFGPEVVVANSGLHLLHFYGQGRDPSPSGIHRWFNYESWLQEVWDRCKALGVKVLLFKTTNFVCDNKYYGKFKKGNRLYSAHDAATLSRCAKLLQAEMESSVGVRLSASEIADYCRHGTFNNAGSAHLNARLEAFVHNLTVSTSSGPTTLLFPNHLMQTCQLTRDARHYRIDPVDVRLLGNVLACLFTSNRLCRGIPATTGLSPSPPSVQPSAEALGPSESQAPRGPATLPDTTT